MLQRGVNGEAELVTRPDAAEAVANVVRSDVQGGAEPCRPRSPYGLPTAAHWRVRA